MALCIRRLLSTVPWGPRGEIPRGYPAAGKALRRGHRWAAIAAVERMPQSLLSLRGRRDSLRLDPADPAGALATVIAEAAAHFHFGARRGRLLEQIGLGGTPARATIQTCLTRTDPHR
jgi:hypothetical protein